MQCYRALFALQVLSAVIVQIGSRALAEILPRDHWSA
jgi:hypothetical protein